MKYARKISALVLLVSFYSFSGVDLRIQGGLNISNEIYWGDAKLPDSFKKKMHVGFNAGASMGIYFRQQLGVVAGLGYETRGSGWKYDTVVADFSMSYLQIPVAFSYRPIQALSIALGPELGIFLAGKTKIGDEKMDLTEIKPIDFGASLNVDYTIVNMVAIGAGYYYGFLNNDDRQRGDLWKGSITNTNIKLYAAYVFHLKK